MNARRSALRLLRTMETTGHFPETLLARQSEQKTSSAEDRDQRLRHELVHGVLRWRGRLDYVLASFSRIPLTRLDPLVLDILRLGAYQILFLSRIPPRAAVDESVKLAVGQPRHIRGFINALLRAVADRGQKVAFPDPEREPVAYLAAWHSHPAWLVERYLGRFGPEEAGQLLAANNAKPPLTVRVNILRLSRPEIAQRLVAEGVAVTPTRFSPEGLVLQGAGDPQALACFREGLFFQVQDEAAQLVSHLLSPREGERVLDACAGRGGKTLHLAQLMRGTGDILALDLNGDKLKVLAEAAGRLGLDNIRTLVHDASVPLEERGEFDRVLLDAPCSGTGVIRRRVDLKWRKRPDDVRRLAALQASMLDAISASVAKGGTIVYAACSLEPEEGEELIRAFLGRHEAFELDDASKVLGTMFPGEGPPYLRTYPHRLERAMDGFFAARLKRAL
ncbi:MAG: 16S rRNA (cytosine(967)-C(5))-methyltransferase RsmB [Pseudomonadota bacterium]